MASDQQMCLSCSVNPATTQDGTVPLCSACKALVSNPRGVEYAKKAEPAEEPTNPPQPPS